MITNTRLSSGSLAPHFLGQGRKKVDDVKDFHRIDTSNPDTKTRSGRGRRRRGMNVTSTR
jgi:hypothetical protein